MEDIISKDTKKTTKTNEINVKKRNGQTEIFEAEKINRVLIWATSGLSGVSASDVAMNAHLQFYPNIKTSQIHKVLIQSAVDLISDKNPNYQYVASNLLNYLLRKEIYETKKEMPSLFECIKRNIKVDLYDSLILKNYTEEEINKCNNFIKHERDYDLTYAGLQQLIDKYLVKDRSTGKSYETPQFAFMMISMTVFANYDKSTRLDFVRELYDMISEHKISLPTPIMAGIRTPNRQFSSCTLIEIGDSLDSIFHGNVAIGQYVAKRAGIGINAGSIRALGSKVRNGEVVHTGVIPFFKMFQSTLHSCSQGGIRKGSATLYFPWWHKEVEDVLVLKNNKGTDDNRVRHMDYGIQFEKLFYSRFVSNGDIALFSPSDVPGLYDSFGLSNFEELYLKY
jgi:ribonucleoside-diphosphate reductase alpha chain